jgi:hypothetical protein
MRPRAFWLVPALLLFPTSALAHDHNADFFFAICYAHASHLGGTQVAFATTLPYKPLSIVGDLGRTFGSHDGDDIDWTTFMGGVRWMIAKSDWRHVPFVQVLVGGGRTNLERFSETNEAFLLGGGYEYILPTERESADEERNTAWGLRVSADFVKNGDQWFKRLSGGIVLRIY